MGKKEDIRLLALESLLLIRKSGRKSGDVTDAVLEKYAFLPKTDRAFYLRLVRGTLENTIRSDMILDVYSKTPVKKMKPVIREILRMAVYQIEKMDSVPDRAAVDEAVKLAEKKGFGSLKGFVNGVLRSFIREPEKYKIPSKDEPALFLQAEYSMPLYLTEKWSDRFGFSTAEKICRSFREEAGITVRVRSRHSSADTIKDHLEKDGARCEKAPYLKDALRLYGTENITELQAFKDGSIIVQDVSSMLAVYAAGIRKGDSVLDVCAAPGGKSILAADLTGDEGKVLSRDINETKIALIEENKARCCVPNLLVEVQNAVEHDESLDGKMDVVLVDAPCSGYGVIGKKCDIIFSASDEKEAALAALQKEILDVSARYVKNGGTLIYSTCTISEKENEDNVRRFLSEHEKDGFRADSLDAFIPEELRCETSKKGYLQLLPGVHDCDGFFIARFTKTAGQGMK